MKTKKEPNYEIKWWKDWLEADILKRLELIENLPFVASIEGVMKSDLDEKLKKHSVATMLNGFFEDLESAMYTKQRLENENENS